MLSRGAFWFLLGMIEWKLLFFSRFSAPSVGVGVLDEKSKVGVRYRECCGRCKFLHIDAVSAVLTFISPSMSIQLQFFAFLASQKCRVVFLSFTLSLSLAIRILSFVLPFFLPAIYQLREKKEKPILLECYKMECRVIGQCWRLPCRWISRARKEHFEACEPVIPFLSSRKLAYLLIVF